MKWTVPIFIAALFSAAILYAFYIDSKVIVYFGNIMQAGSLLLAIINVNMARFLFGPDDEPRKAWGWLAIGLAFWFLGQILGSYREMVLHEVPYGDFSDVFWVVGYIPLLLGVIILIQNFLKTGLPAGSKKSYLLIALISAALFVALLFSVILPGLQEPEKPIQTKLLDVAYPMLDFVLLALSAVLFRISWNLRGGSLAKIWLMLCLGFALTSIADLALIDISELSRAYRYLDILYFSSYFCIAIAGSIQVQTQKLVLK